MHPQPPSLLFRMVSTLVPIYVLLVNSSHKQHIQMFSFNCTTIFIYETIVQYLSKILPTVISL